MNLGNSLAEAFGELFPAQTFHEICQLCFDPLDNMKFFNMIKNPNSTYDQFQTAYGHLELSVSQFLALKKIAKHVNVGAIKNMVDANPPGSLPL